MIKFLTKNYTHFRCSLNLCDLTQECLLENNIEYEQVQDRYIIYKILKKQAPFELKECFT